MAIDRYAAPGFSVISSKTDKQVSTIRKRSIVYETIKESFFKNAVYHIENNFKEEITFALIGMAVALDIYFYH